MSVAKSLSEEINQLIVNLEKVEEERDEKRNDFKTWLGARNFADLNEQARNEYRPKYQALDELNQTVDFMRQKLIASELQSINESSSLLNQNVKSLDESTQSLLRSSRRIEYLTTFVILVAIATISVILLSINQPDFALITITIAVIGLYLIWRRLKRDRLISSS